MSPRYRRDVARFVFDRDAIRFQVRDEPIRGQSFYEGHAVLYQRVKQLTRQPVP